MSILDYIRSANVGSIAVNGKGDAAFVKAMQKFFGLKQDGVISGQNASQKKFRPAVTAVKNGKGGSKTVAKLQEWTGAPKPYDGIWGETTSKYLQKKLVSLGYLGKSEKIDGIAGEKTIKAFQKCLKNGGKKKPDPAPKTLEDKIIDACKDVAKQAHEAKYGWESNPTWEKIKKKGTCVSFVGVVLQRLGYKAKGGYIWQDGKGYGTGKVTHATSRMDVMYQKNKKLSSLKKKIKKGDILVFDDSKSGTAGDGGHICIANGTWADDGDCYVWDIGKAMYCERNLKPRKYDGSHKVLAIVRLKG